MTAPHPLIRAPRPRLGRDFRRLQRPDPHQRPLAALFPRGRLQGRALPDQPDARHGAGPRGLSRHRGGAGAGRMRGHRGAGQSGDRGDGGAASQKGVKAVVMFTAGFAEIGRRRPGDAGRASSRSRRAAASGCAAPIASASSTCGSATPRPFSSFLEEGPTPAGPARHGDAIGRVRDPSPGADRAPRHPGRGVAVDRQRGRRVGRRRHLVPRRRPRYHRDRLLCRGDQGRRGVRRGGRARPRQRQAGHRDEGRRLDDRRRGGGLAHRLARRQRRGL